MKLSSYLGSSNGFENFRRWPAMNNDGGGGDDDDETQG